MLLYSTSNLPLSAMGQTVDRPRSDWIWPSDRARRFTYTGPLRARAKEMVALIRRGKSAKEIAGIVGLPYNNSFSVALALIVTKRTGLTPRELRKKYFKRKPRKRTTKLRQEPQA